MSTHVHTRLLDTYWDTAEREEAKPLKTMALPSGGSEASEIKLLARCLGKNSPIEYIKAAPQTFSHIIGRPTAIAINATAR